MKKQFCPKCMKLKSLTLFGKNKSRKNGLRTYCVVCESEYNKARYKPKQRKQKTTQSVEAVKRNARERMLKFRYNMSLADYDKLAEKQNNACAICHKPAKKNSRNTNFLVVDHCHKTMQVRGLLCHRCNSAVTYFESSELTSNAVSYLQENC